MAAELPSGTSKQPGRGTSLTRDGKIITIPDILHVTPDEIRHHQASDSDVETLPRLGQQPGADTKLSQRLNAAEQGFATRMGMDKPPAIRVADASPALRDVPYIASGYTKEGTPYIQINDAALKSWTPAQIEAGLAFETSRLRNGDGMPEHGAAASNNPAIANRDTFRADRDAAGPMGTNNPKAVREWIEIHERNRLEALSIRGAIDFREPEHPPVHERLARLQDKPATPQFNKSVPRPGQ
ncbi:MAG: hypothetical protein AB7H77_06055 [Bdellovibrionales bacterium]